MQLNFLHEGCTDSSDQYPMDETNNIYLCQVSEAVSCGACCGLYNLPELSQEKLESLLSKRTESFASVPRTEDGIFEFQRQNKGPHRLSRPFAQFHHCPFLGLIGEKNNRVGCLLHPAATGNDGIDYRSLSWYGERACRTYFCPSTKNLSNTYKSILIESMDNWYDFGLIITEHALLISYFKEVESRIGRDVTVIDYKDNVSARDALKEFTKLKSEWLYRREDSPGPCNFFFENSLYPRPEVFRASPDIKHSPYENILKELESGFSSIKELDAANQLLEDLFLKSVQAIVKRQTN